MVWLHYRYIDKYVHSVKNLFYVQCKENGSLATDFALFYIEKADCTGGPIVTKPKVHFDF